MRKKIQDLQRIEAVLGQLASVCRGKGPRSAYPVLDALEDEKAFEDATS